MMAWRALSPRTIVAAAEAVAHRKATGREVSAANARAVGAVPGEPQGGSASARQTPVNDAGVAPGPRLAD